MGNWIDKSSLSTTWSRCAVAKNDVLENLVHRGRITLRQARWMILLMWKSNRNAQISTHPLDINFHSNVDLSSVYIALATPRCPHSNDNMSSTVSIRCSATLTDIIGFSQARTAHSLTMNARSWHSQASCTIKITRRGFMESTCRTNASFHPSSF